MQDSPYLRLASTRAAAYKQEHAGYGDGRIPTFMGVEGATTHRRSRRPMATPCPAHRAGILVATVLLFLGASRRFDSRRGRHRHFHVSDFTSALLRRRPLWMN